VLAKSMNKLLQNYGESLYMIHTYRQHNTR